MNFVLKVLFILFSFGIVGFFFFCLYKQKEREYTRIVTKINPKVRRSIEDVLAEAARVRQQELACMPRSAAVVVSTTPPPRPSDEWKVSSGEVPKIREAQTVFDLTGGVSTDGVDTPLPRTWIDPVTLTTPPTLPVVPQEGDED